MGEQIKGLVVLAGGGDLPIELLEEVTSQNIPVEVIGIKGFADQARLAPWDPSFVGMGEAGKIIKKLDRSRASHLVFAGHVDRPDLKNLKLDLTAMRMMPKVMKAAGKGDGALLDFVKTMVTDRGMEIISPTKLMSSLAATPGVYGSHQPNERDRADIRKGAEIALAIGGFDVAQGSVVAEGFVLAIEAAEGTDEMLKRCGALPAGMSGTAEDRKGVLVKMTKPVQDRDIDQPTIGPRTVEMAAAAGLAGIAIDGDNGIIVDREDAIALADKHGLFIVGVTTAELGLS